MTALHQPDLFPPQQPAELKRCGNCVVWNGRKSDQEGSCTRAGGMRDRDAPPCDQWFGLDQLYAPRYGRKR